MEKIPFQWDNPLLQVLSNDAIKWKLLEIWNKIVKNRKSVVITVNKLWKKTPHRQWKHTQNAFYEQEKNHYEKSTTELICGALLCQRACVFFFCCLLSRSLSLRWIVCVSFSSLIHGTNVKSLIYCCYKHLPVGT